MKKRWWKIGNITSLCNYFPDGPKLQAFQLILACSRQIMCYLVSFSIVFSLGASETSDLQWMHLPLYVDCVQFTQNIQNCICTHPLCHTHSTLHTVQTHYKDAKESVLVPGFIPYSHQITYASHYSFTSGHTHCTHRISVVNTLWMLNMPKSELHHFSRKP